MALRTVQVDGDTYTIADGGPRPEASYIWAVVRAQLRDEITADPPRGLVTVKTPTPGLVSRVGEDGLVGLIGAPQRIFSMLAAQPYSVSMTIRAAGYVPRDEIVTLPAQPGFPATFVPVNLGALPLHRAPVALVGRVLAALNATPVNGATVEISGIWRTPPTPTSSPAASPPDIVSLHPPLHFSRTAATGQLRQLDLTPVLGDDKRLTLAVDAGHRRVRLSNRANLNATDVLMVDALDGDRSEFVTIASIAGGANVNDPADVDLTHPVWSSHVADTVVRRVVPQPPGAFNAFGDDAIRGDTCVLLGSMTNLAAAAVVEISGGPQPAEFHHLHRFSTTSGPDGAYRLPLLSRVAQVQMHVTHGVNGVTSVVSVDYTTQENSVDFVL